MLSKVIHYIDGYIRLCDFDDLYVWQKTPQISKFMHLCRLTCLSKNLQYVSKQDTKDEKAESCIQLIS